MLPVLAGTPPTSFSHYSGPLILTLHFSNVGASTVTFSFVLQCTGLPFSSMAQSRDRVFRRTQPECEMEEDGLHSRKQMSRAEGALQLQFPGHIRVAVCL